MSRLGMKTEEKTRKPNGSRHQIAVLGCAHGHVGLYAEEILQFPDAVITSVWDPDKSRAAAFAETYGCNPADDMEELLRDREVDSVIIGSETSRHTECCVAAAEAGKSIVLQKPMALTLEDCDRILETVKNHGVLFSMAWQMRVDPQNLKIREILQSGILGRITLLRRKHCLSTHLWPDFENSWHVRPELNRGMWMDDAAHAFDFIYWLFGMPSSVFAEIDTLINPRIPDDTGVAVFRLENGAICEVVSSFTAGAGENTTEIHGDQGTLIQNFGDAVSAATPRKPDRTGLKWIFNGEADWTRSDLPSPTSQAERIRALARPIVDFLIGKRPPIATASEGRDVTQMLLASYESASQGRRIHLRI